MFSTRNPISDLIFWSLISFGIGPIWSNFCACSMAILGQGSSVVWGSRCCFLRGSGDGLCGSVEPGQLKWLDVQQKPAPEQSASGKPCLLSKQAVLLKVNPELGSVHSAIRPFLGSSLLETHLLPGLCSPTRHVGLHFRPPGCSAAASCSSESVR